MLPFPARTRVVALALAVPFGLLPFCPTSISTALPVRSQAVPQTAEPATRATAAPQQHPTSTPYTGDFGIFEDKDRDQKLQIERVMDILHLRPGKVVADIGAGGGWFTVRAAKRVAGAGGKVVAEDINPKSIEAIRGRAEQEHLPDVDAVLGTPDNPNLPPGSLDAALMLKVYHEIAHPEVLLGHLRDALKPGSPFGIIDRNGNGADHGLDEKIVRAEVEGAGFKQVGRYTFTKADGQDYFLVFEKR